MTLQYRSRTRCRWAFVILISQTISDYSGTLTVTRGNATSDTVECLEHANGVGEVAD